MKELDYHENKVHVHNGIVQYIQLNPDHEV